MTTLFAVGLVLIGMFGYAVGAYLALYKLALKGTIAKLLTTLVAGTAVTFLTFLVALFIVWPGV